MLVDSTQCHLWTDALHLRQLAREAPNIWDRGTYVRMVVTTAWVALESACIDALDDPRIPYSFKKNLDKAISANGLQPLDWSRGLWQDVRKLQEVRKTYIHRFLALTDMFPEAADADSAVETVRTASQDIYTRAQKAAPDWTHLDHAKGWAASSNVPAPSLTACRENAKVDDPQTVKVYVVRNGVEHLSEVLPPGTDAQPYLDQIIDNAQIPVSKIVVYENGELIKDLQVNMRGS